MVNLQFMRLSSIVFVATALSHLKMVFAKNDLNFFSVELSTNNQSRHVFVLNRPRSNLDKIAGDQALRSKNRR